MIKHSMSRKRSENHIVITIGVGKHEDVKEIKKAIQKTLRRFRRLLNGGLSYEYQIISNEQYSCLEDQPHRSCPTQNH